jgi:hypothetical protein
MDYDDKTLFLNKMPQGILIGFIFPLTFFFLYYLVRFGSLDFGDYLKYLLESKKMVSVLSLSVLPNLLPFLLLMNTNRYSSGRGVLAATIILGVAVFILKLF